MKKIYDYIFHNGWHMREAGITLNEEYIVLMDLGDLKKDEVVKFIGYDDVDNHYGIFVFSDASGKLLEVSGDFCGPDHPCMKALKRALLKKP